MTKQTQGRLTVNMASYAALQVVNMLVGLFLPRLYLAVYGSEINGIISTANSFISYFSYLEAGIGLTLIHALFQPLARNDRAALNGLLAYSQKQYRRISYLYFALVVGLSLSFPFFSPTEALGKGEFVALVLVIGLYGALDFFTMAKYRVLLTADRKEYVISYAMILAQLIRFVLVWLLLRTSLSVVFVKIVPILTLLIRSLILRGYIRRHYPAVNYAVPPVADLSVTGSRWDALLLQISINTSLSLPTIVISQTLGFKEANVYAVYSLAACSMISIVSALSSGVSPKMGQSLARDDRIEASYRLYDYAVSAVIALVFSVTAVMLLPFVRLYTDVAHDVNYLRPLYAVLIAIWAALYSYRIPMTAVINAAGIYRENRVHNLVNLGIQLVGGIAGALLAGIPGLLISMIAASLQRNIAFALVNSRALLHNGLKRTLLYQAVIVLLIGGSCLLAAPLLKAVSWSVWSWVAVASLVFAAEAVLVTIVFVLLDRSCAVQLYRKISGVLAARRHGNTTQGG